MAQHAGLCSTAEGQQEQSVRPDHLVGLHSGQRPWGLHLQRFLPGLLHLAKNMQTAVDTSLRSPYDAKF